MAELTEAEIMLLDAHATNVAWDYGLKYEHSGIMLSYVTRVAKERGIENNLDALLEILQGVYSIPLTNDPDELLHQIDSQFEFAN